MSHLIRRICIAAGFLIAIGFVTPAQAVTGYVRGVYYFRNKNGNFCPYSNACTGARYTQNLYDADLPVSNASIWVIDSGSNIIGLGATDNDGNYTVAWNRSTFPTQIGVLVFPYQKDGRFYLANSAGQLINNWFGLINTASSSSASDPQWVGSWVVGSSAAPDPFYNAYWAVEWMWRFTMNLVGVLQTNFTNVEIRGFADAMPGYITETGYCNTSCAWGPTKQVHLDQNAGRKPQARALHEVGHIAEYVTHPWQLKDSTGYVSGLAYGWGGDSGWRMDSPEYGSAAFEEAWATHYGSATFWMDNAVSPTTCNSSEPCYESTGAPSSNTDLEASSFPYFTNNCIMDTSNPEGRWPLSAMRYFWDVFDNHNDGIGDGYSASQGNWWQHFYNLGWYPEGTGTFQINEPWNSTLTDATEPDGRGSSSYTINYSNNVTDTGSLAINNCSPP